MIWFVRRIAWPSPALVNIGQAGSRVQSDARDAKSRRQILSDGENIGVHMDMLMGVNMRKSDTVILGARELRTKLLFDLSEQIAAVHGSSS